MDDRPDAQILIKRVTDTSSAERVNAINALGAIRCLEACNCLSYALRDFDRLVRRSALRALENIGEPAYYQIVHGLKFGSADVRELAAEVLGRMNNVDAVSPLTDALGDQDKLVRLSAVRALENIGKPAYPQIVHGLKFGSADVRELAAEVLGRMNNVDAVSPLTDALGDQDKLVRLSAVRALANLGTPRAIKALIMALSAPNLDVQRAAKAALIKAGPQACGPLRDACDDDDARLKKLTADILDKIENAEQTEDAHYSVKICERCNCLFKTSEQDANEEFCSKCRRALNDGERAEQIGDAYYCLKTCVRCNSLFETHDANQAVCSTCRGEKDIGATNTDSDVRACEYCHMKFKPKNESQRFCSSYCLEMSYKAGTKREELAPAVSQDDPVAVPVAEQPNAERGDLTARQCEYCKKEFTPHGKTQRFCSPVCLARSKAQATVHKSCLRCGLKFESAVDEKLCKQCNFELNNVAYLLNKGINRKVCERCEKEYYPTGLNQRFCSRSCSSNAGHETTSKREELVPPPSAPREGPVVVPVAEQPNAERGDLTARQCEYCKKEFTPHGKTQRFCSPVCLASSSKARNGSTSKREEPARSTSIR